MENILNSVFFYSMSL